ncbi:unnamed protein product [Spodoptera exigua]|nr:unnamed protein product [Spodoptera exigua]
MVTIRQKTKETEQISSEERDSGDIVHPLEEFENNTQFEEGYRTTGQDVNYDSQENEMTLEIPDKDQWAEMLGIPPMNEPTSSTTGKIRNKVHIHSKTPYQRPSTSSNANYMF